MKQKSLSSLRKLAWKLWSQHVRSSATDHRGFVACVTCQRLHHWKEIHAGHFIHISKQHPLSYDSRNVHPQCRQCNYYGAKGIACIQYTLYLQKRYGEEIVDKLLSRRKEPYLRRFELENLIEMLKNGTWQELEARTCG